MQPQYGYSFDEEHYHGKFDSRDKAIAEARDSVDFNGTVFTGELVTPSPEDFITGDVVIEHIACQDEFSGDWAEGWAEDATLYEKELTEMLQKTVAEWVGKYNIRPTFYNIERGTVQEHKE